MSTLRNLAHFLEDDSAPQVLPMEISVRDTHINLKVRTLRVCFFAVYFHLLAFRVLFHPEVIVGELHLQDFSRIFVLLCCNNRPHNSLPYSAAASITRFNILNHGLIGIWI